MKSKILMYSIAFLILAGFFTGCPVRYVEIIDPTPPPTPSPTPIPVGTEILHNNEFTNDFEDDWGYFFEAGSAGTVVSDLDAGCVKITVANPGSEDWNICFYQDAEKEHQIDLDYLASYEMKLRARADSSRTIDFGIGQSYEPYESVCFQSASLGSEYQDFTVTFDATQSFLAGEEAIINGGMQFYINLGYFSNGGSLKTTVYIDYVSLKKTKNSSEVPIYPAIDLEHDIFILGIGSDEGPLILAKNFEDSAFEEFHLNYPGSKTIIRVHDIKLAGDFLHIIAEDVTTAPGRPLYYNQNNKPIRVDKNLGPSCYAIAAAENGRVYIPGLDNGNPAFWWKSAQAESFERFNLPGWSWMSNNAIDVRDNHVYIGGVDGGIFDYHPCVWIDGGEPVACGLSLGGTVFTSGYVKSIVTDVNNGTINYFATGIVGSYVAYWKNGTLLGLYDSNLQPIHSIHVYSSHLFSGKLYTFMHENGNDYVITNPRDSGECTVEKLPRAFCDSCYSLQKKSLYVLAQDGVQLYLGAYDETGAFTYRVYQFPENLKSIKGLAIR